MEKPFSPFDPEILSKISNLTISAQTVVQGVLSGIHKSQYKGSSIEFLEHKKYSQGDDIKQIDWKLFARSDRHYIKQFEDETNIRSCVCVDSSGSMGYKSAGVSKFEYALILAASLSYLIINQSDAAGLFAFGGDGGGNYIPPRSDFAHFNYIIEELKKLRPRGKSDIAEAIMSFSGKTEKRLSLIVISDFFDDADKMINALKQYRCKKNDVILLQILDPYELEFPFDKPTRFVSMEDERSLSVDPKVIREDYLAKIKGFIKHLRQQCLLNRIDHCVVNTADPVDKTIMNYLSARNNGMPMGAGLLE